MPLVAPPNELARRVEYYVPGVWSWWRTAIETALRGVPVQITSWWRSPAHNRTVGGASTSQHLIGTAVDLVFPTSSAKREGIGRLRHFGLTVIDEGDHVHVQLWPAGAANELVRALALG